jgi:hypothetical protein
MLKDDELVACFATKADRKMVLAKLSVTGLLIFWFILGVDNTNGISFFLYRWMHEHLKA